MHGVRAGPSSMPSDSSWAQVRVGDGAGRIGEVAVAVEVPGVDGAGGGSRAVECQGVALGHRVRDRRRRRRVDGFG